MPNKDHDGEAPEQFIFGMVDMLENLELAQAKEATEKQSILESIQFDLEVTTNRRLIHEADVKWEELFVDEDDE